MWNSTTCRGNFVELWPYPRVYIQWTKDRYGFWQAAALDLRNIKNTDLNVDPKPQYT